MKLTPVVSCVMTQHVQAHKQAQPCIHKMTDAGKTPLSKPSQLKSDVWNHFRFKTAKDKELDKTKVVCKVCQAELSYCRNTTNLRNHLTRYHTTLTLASDNKPDWNCYLHHVYMCERRHPNENAVSRESRHNVGHLDITVNAVVLDTDFSLHRQRVVLHVSCYRPPRFSRATPLLI